jgi:hypothetical protein
MTVADNGYGDQNNLIAQINNRFNTNSSLISGTVPPCPINFLPEEQEKREQKKHMYTQHYCHYSSRPILSSTPHGTDARE